MKDDALEMVRNHRQGAETPLSPDCRRTVHTIPADPRPDPERARKIHEDVVDAPFDLVKKTPDLIDRLKAVSRSTLVFALLAWVLLYWWQSGLLAQEAAYPAIVVCTLLAGIGIGRNLL